MRIRRELPVPVRTVENVWIPMADGCRLAARLWLPEGAEDEPVPAVLEYLPYRKRDWLRQRDEPMHGYFAGHGLACVRVDLRGTGDSEGLLEDEYLEQEQRDGVEVIRWIAEQAWCSGAVGMMGKSWGGFNALQVAALRPPALRAIVTVCSTDDRYADDAHYMGGCLLNENLTWGSMLLTLNSFPPDPRIAGPSWRETWLARLEATPLFPELWLRHQRRDAYWRQGSVCEDFGAIRCPVLAVGGWADAYSNAVPRLLAGLRVPRRGLIGPWTHVYPQNAAPGTAIGFLQLALNWWRRWLGPDDSTEAEVEPFLRAWIGRSGEGDRAAGRWVAEPAWPPRWQPLALALARGRLTAEAAPEDEVLEIASPQTVGSAAGAWCAFTTDALPGEQSADDECSAVFDGEPLPAELELLGAPVLELELESSRPVAQLAARLCELSLNGRSTRVTYGLLNLTHREGHAEPRPLVPGERTAVRLRLNDVGHAFRAGARIRLALSSAYWPIAWPSPERARIQLHLARCRLLLPVRPSCAGDAELEPLPPPEAAPAPEVTELVQELVRHEHRRDPASGEEEHVMVLGEGEDGALALDRIEAIELVLGHSLVQRFSIRPRDPLSARARIEHRAHFERPGWKTEVRTRVELRSTRSSFLLEAELEARENGRTCLERTWRSEVPRDLV